MKDEQKGSSSKMLPRLKRAKHRPMPADPRKLARAMFRQADKKMFGGRVKKKPDHSA